MPYLRKSSGGLLAALAAVLPFLIPNTHAQVDTVPPTITKVTGSSSFNRVTVTFSEPVTAATAGVVSNYSFAGTPGLTISAVTVLNSTNVALTTSAQAEGASYTLRVSNIKDTSAAGNTITANTQATVLAFKFSPGYANWERWNLSNGDTLIGALEQNVLDPKFRSPDVTGLSGFFGAPRDVADNYGAKVTGFFVAPRTGNYIFFLQCDDNGRLFLSTDDKPANKKLIASQPAWGNANEWQDPDTDENQSDLFSASEWPTPNAISLTAGRRYYMEGLVSEQGGGDGIEVYYQVFNAADGPPAPPSNGTAPNTVGLTIGTLADPTGSSVTITQQPQSQTLNEGPKARVTVVATGSSPIIYQWQKAPPGSSTFTDIAGATSSGYTTPNLVLADSGSKYRVVLYVLGGATATSSEATLSVVADTFPPKVLGAGALKKGTAIEIGVGFDEPVDETTASAVANYSLSAGTVTGVRFQKYISSGDGPGSGEFGSAQNSVVLTTSGVTSTANVTVTVRNIRDRKNNAIPAAGVTATVAPARMSWVGVGGNEYVEGGDPATQWPDDAAAYSNKDFDLVSGGSAHWDGYDELTFVYEAVSGDFDKKVRVEYQDPSSQWARAGMMIREALDEGVTRPQIFDQPDGVNNPTGVKMSQVFTTRVNPAIGHIIDPSDPSARSPANNSYEVIHRPRAGFRYGGTGEGVNPAFNIASGFGGAPSYPNAWIRIQRRGQTITTWRSDDGVNWQGGANVTYTDIADTPEIETLSTNLFVGVFYAPEFGNNNSRTEVGHSVHAKFRDYGDFVTGGGGGIRASIARVGNTISISWTGTGVLQSADTITGVWTPVVGGTTSPVVITPTGTARFYRVQ
jgi:hypothetical protein